MNSEQLAQAVHINPAKAEQWIDAINQTFEFFDISTPEQQASFLGQCGHESNGFTALVENLNYKAESLCKVWPKRFPTLEAAQPYHRNPEAIANHVYANRMGNGDEDSGDGFAFRGRGLIQLTGRANYKACGEALGVDLELTPELVETPQFAALSAGWFWSTHDLNRIAEDIVAVTKKINGGTLGLDDRVARTERALNVLA
ncbi:COG3179 Predicted chitinase [uncultured Caudovirales phage]|uniref:COG3179 Predicted chitinase n=1 Tax=uncultured Caudovirales phage TaxID=2100421 RepID=A0A6J5LH23_9CAUD|nr:COG3179 Predicted chitinase [uncultured Caudovirales phage]